MKKLPAVLLLIFICSVFVFPEEAGETGTAGNSISGEAAEDLPVIKQKPFIVFNEGVAATWITRIIKQENRSNFVFEDFMAGAYFGFKTVNMEPLNSMVRLTVYYPLSSKFNDFPQKSVNVILFGIDLFAGVDFELNMWDYVRINISPGLHFLYQTSDRWNYINLGIAGLVGLEIPISQRWTILLNGVASLDSGNFGNNKTVEPYDLVYQYQLDVGVRYSKRNPNTFSYIKPRK